MRVGISNIKKSISFFLKKKRKKKKEKSDSTCETIFQNDNFKNYHIYIYFFNAILLSENIYF